MSSLKENQNKIPALEAEIVELKAEMVVFKAELIAEGKSASEILVLLSEMTRQLNLLLERRERLEQQTSAGCEQLKKKHRVEFDGIIVSHWRTQKHKMVEYDDNVDLETFVKRARVKFLEELIDPSKGCSLFFVENGTQEANDRTRVNESNFDDCIQKCRNAKAMKAQPTMYFHDDESSPQGTPAQQALPVRPRSDASSNRSGQDDYSDRVHRRDDGKCVFCDSIENLMGAHVVEIKEGDIIDNSFFRVLGLSGFMDTANGMTLCKACHDQYDAYYVCLDEDSKLVVSDALLMSSDSSLKAKWSKLCGKTVEVRTTAGHWVTTAALQHRFSKFLLETNKRRGKAAVLTFMCDKCNYGFSTRKGLNTHVRAATRCAKLQLATKAKIRSQQTPKK